MVLTCSSKVSVDLNEVTNPGTQIDTLAGVRLGKSTRLLAPVGAKDFRVYARQLSEVFRTFALR